MLECYIYRLILVVEINELAALDRLCFFREHLLDQFGDLSVTDVRPTVLGHDFALSNHEVEQASEKTVEEEVKLVSVELCLGLEPEEEHYV